MTFSIIMPIYNVERYLQKSIESVLSQNFKDFELILIDDASRDRCGDICESFAKKDPRVRLVHNKQNLGVCATRNVGIDLARGDWIWFADPDDTISPNSLETLSHHLSSGLDVIFFGFQYVIEAGDYRQVKSKISLPVHVGGTSNREIAAFVLANDFKHTFSPLWNKLYRRDFMSQYAIAFRDTTLEDAFFNFSVFSHTNRIQTVDGCFYSYLRRKSGSLSKKKAWNRLDIYKKRYHTVLQFLKEKDALTGANRAKAFYCYFSRLFYVMYVAIVSKK